MSNICRLCLQSDSKYHRMDTDDYRRKMQSIIPEINIQMVEEPFICVKCSELLLSAYSFKTNCLQTDKELKTYTKHHGQQIKLEEFLRQKNEDLLSNIKMETIVYFTKDEGLDEDVHEENGEDIVQKPEDRTQDKPSKTNIDETMESQTLLEKANEMKPTNKKIATIRKQKQKIVINKCEICNRVFLRKGGLDRHLKGHEHFKCSVCDLNFSCKSFLNEHMRTHTGERPFQCTYCGKAFSQSGTLNTHVRSVHMSERPYVCEVCGLSFAVRGAYTSHKRTRHNTEEEKKFICSFCGKAFLFKNLLLRHMKWHTGERNYLCQVCSKRFVNNSSLMKHMRIHNGEKPFECPICQKTFTQNYNKKVHVKSCSRRNARTADAND